MGLPQFSPDYLASPTMTGVIPSSTVNLLQSEGNALAQKIEVQSQKAEAQAKAPAIATAYEDAFTKISQGDLSGFAGLEKANSLAAGNPFLTAMAKDASNTAHQMASQFFQQEQQKRQFEQSATLQTKSQDFQKTQTAAGNMFSAGQRALDRQSVDERSALNAFNQADANWLKLDAKAESDRAAAQEAEDLQARITPGYTRKVIPKAKMPPRPTKDQYLTNQSLGNETSELGAAGDGNPLFATNDVPLPTSTTPDLPAQDASVGAAKEAEAQLAAEQAGKEAQKAQPGAKPLPAAGQQESPEAALVKPQLQVSAETGRPVPTVVKMPKGNIDVAPLGSMALTMPIEAVGQSGMPVLEDVTIKLPHGNTMRYKVPKAEAGAKGDSKLDNWNQVKESVGILNNGFAGFAEYAAQVAANDDKIDFGTKDADGNYHPVSLKGVKYGYPTEIKEGNKVTKTFVQVPVGKDVHDEWVKASGALGKLGTDVGRIFSKPKFDDDQKGQMRQGAFGALFQQKATMPPDQFKKNLDETNANLNKFGIARFEEKDFEKKDAKATEGTASDRLTKAQDELVKNVGGTDKAKIEANIKEVQSAKAASDKEGREHWQDERKKEQKEFQTGILNKWKEKYDGLKKSLANTAASRGGTTDLLKAKKAELDQLAKEIKEQEDKISRL
jgi:hypothetical protein